jgi:O-antigen/teichoic acid export membrane protein
VLLGNLLYNLDVFVLGAVKSGAEVGLYVAAYRLLTVFSPVLGALQNSSLPEFGRLYPDGAAAQRLAFGVWRTSAGAAVGFAILLAGAAGVLLPLLYGEAFGGAKGVVGVLALVLPVQVTRMVFRQPLLAFRGEREDLRNLAIAVAVNLGLDVALAPAYGGMGCAVSTLVAEGCFAGLTWRSWRRVACA